MGSYPREFTKPKGEAKSPSIVKVEPPKQNDSVKKSEEPSKESKESLPRPHRPRQNSSQSGDYFSGSHEHAYLAGENNPFEFSFAGSGKSNANGSGAVQTPGGTRLPPVSDLNLSVGILGSGSTTNFWNSNPLRSGGATPPMIGGSQKSRDDYFSDEHHIRDLRGNFITANESALRSGFTPGAESHGRAGLTPGGSGSMFPEPIPNPPNIFNSMTSRASTPPLEFHRVAMNPPKRNQTQQQTTITSQPQEHLKVADAKAGVPNQFDDAKVAASGLFLLAQSREGQQPIGNYALPTTQLPIHAHPPAVENDSTNRSVDTSPLLAQISRTSISNGESASENEKHPSNRRERGKKYQSVSNGRRKASEPPPKGHSAKKSKSNSGVSQNADDQGSEDDADKNGDIGTDGKKMTDEEKRKNFLERNRIAALKCRQRKKQWLNSLQAKVEVYASENEGLTAQIQALRDEIVHIKTLLLAHKECPVSVAQGISGMNMHQVINDSGFTAPIHPYTMGAPLNQQQQVINSQALQQRRFS